MGLRQRLSLAVAVLHEPQILILDEPTSGVDPVARDSFWELLIDLSRKQGVTIFVTTHFMNEGMRCDRISLMNSGKVLACDAPQKLIEARGATSLEEAFIGYMEDAIAAAAPDGKPQSEASIGPTAKASALRLTDALATPRSSLGDWPDAGVHPQRNDANLARPGAIGLRFRRFSTADARFWLWTYDRRRAHSLCGVRSRSVARKSRISGAILRARALTL